MSTLFRRTSSGVARRPRRGEPKRVPAQHLLQSRASRVFGNTWVRLACGVSASLALTSFALGSQRSGGDHHAAHEPAATVVTQGAGVDAFAVNTATITPAGLPTPTSSARKAPGQNGLPDASSLAADGIPSTALDAYEKAATAEKGAVPSCGLSWPLLAAIGRVESDHGRFAGALLHVDGVSTPRIIGRALDGHGVALIRDSDHGRLDGDKIYDRAVGPMQFIPTTWAEYGVDANSDHIADPFNVYDAARTAAIYLCDAGGDLTTLAGQTRAIRAYNNSDDYLKLVLATESIYAKGVAGVVVPALPSTGVPPTKPAPVPPVNPGPPLGLGGPTSGVAGTATSTAPGGSSTTVSPSPTGGGSATTSSSASSSPLASSTSAAPPTSSSAPPLSSSVPPPSSSAPPSSSTAALPSPSARPGGS